MGAPMNTHTRMLPRHNIGADGSFGFLRSAGVSRISVEKKRYTKLHCQTTSLVTSY